MAVMVLMSHLFTGNIYMYACARVCVRICVTGADTDYLNLIQCKLADILHIVFSLIRRTRLRPVSSRFSARLEFVPQLYGLNWSQFKEKSI